MTSQKLKIAPSILGADLGCLLNEVKKVEKDADLLHIDVMDGHFVPNITFGVNVVKSLKGRVNLPFDVHLMVEEPERWIEAFAEVGCEFISFHIEATVHPGRLINYIREKGSRVGIALNPATPECLLNYILPRVDMILVMTVNPGFGGQDFLPEVLPKIRTISRSAEKEGVDIDIAVDGGINEVTAEKVVKEGANVLVMGSYIFKSPDPGKLIVNLKNKLSNRGFKRRK